MHQIPRSVNDTDHMGAAVTMATNKNSTDGAGRVTGPASYFPSIEKTYGQPMEYWFGLVRDRGDEKHMQTVAWLKSEHGMGHGHAGAVVAYIRATQGES